MGRDDSSDSEPASADCRGCFFAGEGPGVTNRPGDDRRDRMLGDGDVWGLAVFVLSMMGLRTFTRTGISSSSSLLSMVATIDVSCCASCGADCTTVELLPAASRFFMSSYAASPSLSSSSFVSLSSICSRDIVRGFVLTFSLEFETGASSSDAELPSSDSASLSEESDVRFRRAARSVGRGLVDASVARAGEDRIDIVSGDSCVEPMLIAPLY